MWTHPHRPNAPTNRGSWQYPDGKLLSESHLRIPLPSLTSVSLSLASRADRGPLVLSLILSLSWMAFIQASAFSTLLSNSSWSCWVIAFEKAERTGNREVSRFWVRPEQEWKVIQRRKGEKLMMLWLSFLNSKTKSCSRIAVQLSTENISTLQLSQMKIHQETKRRWRTVGGSFTVNRLNSKLLNEINLVFVCIPD